MDDITETSLAALIHRATDPRNPNPDTKAIDAVCGLINKEQDAAYVASKLIANKIQSTQEWEALQGLSVLEACMKNCGASFHSEVGKFRFLNEMIKLVSPKYLGSKTAPLVKKQVLLLLHSWTLDYPKESKIKEAYEMLKKQGVYTKEDTQSIVTQEKTNTQRANPLFQDEEKSKLLQKLLQSKNPDDLQAANRLIKTMVKEDERRTELKSKQLTELETIHNNVKLLDEMLDSYRIGQTSTEEKELMKELHQGCERLRINLFKLVAETPDNGEMLNQVLVASDELTNVFEKYRVIIELNKPYVAPASSEKSLVHLQNLNSNQDGAVGVSSLLDLSTPAEESSGGAKLPGDLLNGSLAGFGLDLTMASKVQNTSPSRAVQNKTDLGELDEIFGCVKPQTTLSQSPQPQQTTPTHLIHNIGQLTPVKVPPTSKQQEPTEELCSKTKALKDLDALGENLLKQCKMDVSSSFRSDKLNLNILSKQSSLETKPPDCASTSASDVELLTPDKTQQKERKESKSSGNSELLNGDDIMVDLTEEITVTTEKDNHVNEIKPLTDIHVSLDSIKPRTNVSPLNVIEQSDGVTVTLHFTQDSPRQDVSVIVVTTVSKHKLPVTNYMFQAVVPKSCKLKMQPPSATELPAFNPFLPPAAITQIMLISNPNKSNVSLKIMISYTCDDETVTDMGEVEQLPIT